MAQIDIRYLNYSDVQALALTDAEIVAAVEQGLLAQGRGEAVIEPRMHLVPEKDYPGHFNVLRGYIRPLGLAGFKLCGDYYRNYEVGLPSELAVLTLHDPKTGAPVAIIDASDLTDMRTGAVTAIGAKHLARRHVAVACTFCRCVSQAEVSQFRRKIRSCARHSSSSRGSQPK